MSMFNAEQLAHMASIAKLPPEQISWCGWGRAGDADCCAWPGCVGKTMGLTLADKAKVWCPDCHNEPRDGVITHRKGCSHPAVPALCAHCKLRPAACIGAYDDMPEALPACDTCCGHGCEDGHCDPIDDASERRGEDPR